MQNTCLIPGGGVLLGGGLETSFVSEFGSKLGVNQEYGGRMVFGLAGGEVDVADLGEEELIHNGKEPV